MKHILVTGGGGLLAHQLKTLAPRDFEFSFLGHADFDLLDPRLMAQRLGELKPQVVINTAAYNLVDRCETEREEELLDLTEFEYWGLGHVTR